MNRKKALIAGLGAVVLCASIGAAAWTLNRGQSAEAALAKWREAAVTLDEAALDAAIDKTAVVASYRGALRSSLIKSYEANDEIVELGLVPTMIEGQSAYIESLSREYASPRGVRALLLRCDPRTQTDEGFASTPSVTPTLTVTDGRRATLSCEMPNSDDKILAAMERREGSTWQIVRVELPSPMPAWAGPD